MAFKSSAVSHVGMVRKMNEDSYAERTDIGVWAVADGMGGHEAGELASGMVTDFIKSLPMEMDFDTKLETVQKNIHAANRRLLEQASSYDTQRVPGSTVVALIIDGNRGAVVWAGDSRLYRRRDGVVNQVTRDHSHVQDLVEQGIIHESDAESHPMANVITRAVGIGEPLELDSRVFEVKSEDQFLLCSDGLSRLASNEEIESMMSNKDSDEVAQSLLHTALVRGAPDNVTLICVKNCTGEQMESFVDESTIVFETGNLDDYK